MKSTRIGDASVFCGIFIQIKEVKVWGTQVKPWIGIHRLSGHSFLENVGQGICSRADFSVVFQHTYPSLID